MLKNLKTHVKNITDSAKYIEYAEQRLGTLRKYLKVTDGEKWNLRLSKEGGVRKGDIYHAEAQVKTAVKNFGADAQGETPYEAIDEVKNELAKKMTHYKDKRITRLKRGAQQAKDMLLGRN